LRESSKEIIVFNSEIKEFVRGMVVFMQAHGGVGLAAPQIGVLRRIIVADIGTGPVCLVNPSIVVVEGAEYGIEGCLSLPEVFISIDRKTRMEIRAKSPEGNLLHFAANGLLARVLQHEIDHLDGVLITDYGVPEVA